MAHEEEFSPFNYPEAEEIFNQLFDKVLDESGRGAIIIGTTYVEELLTKLIEDFLPEANKKSKDRLFNYPGPLSSFSAKIELSYAFRLIDKTLYDCLNALRKVRNDAAHSSSKFSLRQIREKMNSVYGFGPSFHLFIQDQAFRIMMHIKKDGVERVFDEHNLSKEEREEHLKRIIADPKIIEKLEEQLPHWELISGLTFLCGLLAYTRQKTLLVIKDNSIWSDFAYKLKASDTKDNEE